jgi:hypothetical protein
VRILLLSNRFFDEEGKLQMQKSGTGTVFINFAQPEGVSLAM